MASGDPFLIKQLSGNGNTFSYTPAAGVWLCVTGVGGYNVILHLEAGSSPYIDNYIKLTTNNNFSIKKIFGDGTGIFGNDANINSYGVALNGVEL